MAEDIKPESPPKTEATAGPRNEAPPTDTTLKNEIQEKEAIKKKASRNTAAKNDSTTPETPSEDSPSTSIDDMPRPSQHNYADKFENPKELPAATSLLLQGSAKTATKTLFLLPDGSGSATSYSLLPTISPSLAVYGLNSPFIKCPRAFETDIPGLTALYVAEILRRQAEGPYYLGGWSAGGVCAYEAVLQLQAAGKKVERLILLDSPCPTDLDILPGNLHRWFDSIGLLGPDGNEGGTPEWLIPHLDAATRSLSEYEPATIESAASAHMPKTCALWAKDGVCKFPTDPRPPQEKTVHIKFKKQPKSVMWLLENREGAQLQRNGWERFLGEDCVIETSVVEDANHFTLIKEEHVQRVSEFVRDAVE